MTRPKFLTQTRRVKAKEKGALVNTLLSRARGVKKENNIFKIKKKEKGKYYRIERK